MCELAQLDTYTQTSRTSLNRHVKPRETNTVVVKVRGTRTIVCKGGIVCGSSGAVEVSPGNFRVICNQEPDQPEYRRVLWSQSGGINPPRRPCTHTLECKGIMVCWSSGAVEVSPGNSQVICNQEPVSLGYRQVLWSRSGGIYPPCRPFSYDSHVSIIKMDYHKVRGDHTLVAGKIPSMYYNCNPRPSRVVTHAVFSAAFFV